MIISNSAAQTVIIDGESHVKTASIDNTRLAKLQYILTTGLYKDGISAVMVELCNNGMDSVIESKKDPIANPVVVRLFKDGRGHYQLSIEDKGLGMSSDFFENRFMNLLDSTKEESNESIGHFGIGGKSWSSLNRSVTFTITQDGKKSKYLCYKGEQFIDYDPIYKDSETDEENGVLFELQIQDYYEYSTFCTKAKQKLAYYETVVLFIDGKLWENKIYRNDLFQWSSNIPSQNLHLCLKDVIYTIDYERLGIPSISVPIALRFGLDSGLSPTPSREDILFNKDSIKIIKDRIKEVAEFFVNKYNENVKEFETFKEAYPFIDVSNYVVKLEDRVFNIQSLEEHSSIKFEEAKVKGITLKSPVFYRSKRRYFLDEEYSAIAYDSGNGTWKTKHISYQLINHFNDFMDRGKERDAVLVEYGISGNVKEYLRDQYGSDTVYAHKYKSIKLGKDKYHGYRELLNLDKYPRTQWRALIQEWQFVQKQLLDEFFKDERKVESSPEYIEWLEEKKAEQKANRAKGIYKGKYLNKQEGDITVAFSRLSALDRKTVVFEKKAVPLKDLYKNKYITLYWEDTPENKIIASKYHHLTTPFKLKIALIGKRELVKLPKLHNFMQEQDYIKTAQFRKFVTAIKAKKVIDTFDAIYSGHITAIKTLVGKYAEDVDRLRKYYTTNWSRYVPGELIVSMMHIAEQHNYFDLEEMVVINRVQKDVERFDFITMLDIPSQWDGAAIKKYNTIIYQMLLFRKLYHKQFTDFEIVEAPPVGVIEAMYVDETGEIECDECDPFELEPLVDEDFTIDNI